MKFSKLALIFVNSFFVLGGVIPATNEEEVDVASIVEDNINIDRLVDLHYNSVVSDEDLNFWLESSKQHIVNSILVANNDINDEEKAEEVHEEVLNEIEKEIIEAEEKYNDEN